MSMVWRSILKLTTRTKESRRSIKSSISVIKTKSFVSSITIQTAVYLNNSRSIEAKCQLEVFSFSLLKVRCLISFFFKFFLKSTIAYSCDARIIFARRLSATWPNNSTQNFSVLMYHIIYSFHYFIVESSSWVSVLLVLENNMVKLSEPWIQFCGRIVK